ncbi:MAG TPA: hypothetical protein VFV98_20755 [Vicinamibacterales bacterium]|nr:hypothetical protein [Vicinamibacterales bacterium]
MRTTHEPEEDFVNRLELEIGAELRRRRTVTPAPWLLRTRLRVAAAAAMLAIVSMAAGGAGVAAAYHAKNVEQRDQLVSAYEQRVALAEQQLNLAEYRMRTTAQRVSIGTAAPLDAMQDRVRVVEAEAELSRVRSQLAEVRLTGREPETNVLAALVSGQDLVSERWRFDLMTPRLALDVEKQSLQEMQRRVDVGAAPAHDVTVSRSRIGELEAAMAAVERKLAIRQRFLKKEIGAAEADLRIQEIDAETRQTAVRLKIMVAAEEATATQRKFAVGLAQQTDVAEASLRLRELEAELAKSELDLARVRAQIAQLKGK